MEQRTPLSEPPLSVNFVGIDTLQEVTAQFFRLHWSAREIGRKAPSWKGPYLFRGALPYPEEGGCYALYQGATLRYIGLGASRAV
jgi:hypothetical protein